MGKIPKRRFANILSSNFLCSKKWYKVYVCVCVCVLGSVDIDSCYLSAGCGESSETEWQREGV